MISCKLVIKNDLKLIEHISSFIESLASSIGFSESELFKIKLAFEETLNNTFESCIDEDDNVIEIIATQISGGIEIVIHDNGLPFNPFRKIIKDDIIADFDTSREEISEQLIVKLVDSFSFTNLGKKGKETKLVFYSKNFRIDNLIQDIKPDTDDNHVDDSFKQIRLFESQDAYEVSKLFYLSYGYSYVNDLVYYPDRMLNYIDNGRLHSAVAVSEKGQIIGFSSLFEPDNSRKITEWGMAVSDPRYRGQGVMNYNAEFIIDHAATHDYHGIFAHAVTNHIFTQKSCAKYGLTPCALFIGYAPDLKFKKINSELSQRESTYIVFKYFKKPDHVKLFIQEKYKNIIKSIYSGLGVSIESLQIRKDIQISTKQQEISEQLESVLNSVNININVCGEETVESIRKITKQHCLNKIENIYLFMNLEDEYAMSKVDEIVSHGYLFVGVFPEFVFQHTIVFQYINNSKYDFDKILSYSDTALMIKDNIKSTYYSSLIE